MGKEDTGVLQLESRLNRNPQSLVFSQLADCYRKNGEVQQAIDVCLHGLANHPQYLTGRVILGRCYLENEKLKEANDEFVKVVEVDRRNQVAVKMIADICARQGMRERAGDLYAYLLGMDPDNAVFVKLAGTFRGSGDRDVLSILGVHHSSREGVSPEQASGGLSAETMVDADRTMEQDFGRPVEPSGDPGDTFVKTQRLEPAELREAPGIVDEIAPQSGTSEGGVVTGDDVTSRMSRMFGELEEPASGVEEEILDHVEIGEDRSESVNTVVAPEASAGGEPGVISGSDITSRIEQLFGDGDAASIPSASGVVDKGEGSPEPAPPEPGALDFSRPADELRPVEQSAISGEDIASRLNEMFDGAPPPAYPEEEAAVGIAEETRRGTPGDEDNAPSAAGKEVEEIVIGDDDATPLSAATNDVISGDDVTLRLDTMFDQREIGVGTEGDSTYARVSDATDVSGTDVLPPLAEVPDPPEDEPETTVPQGDMPIVIGEEDEVESASETLISPPASQSQAPDDEPIIDDLVAPGVEDEAPGMSGDDVVGRMEELFNESLINTAASQTGETIPEGDREDDIVNPEYYTMSGENAETAEEGDRLLPELDRTETVPPAFDAPDQGRETEEKTVLMDQDDGAGMRSSEQQPILSGAIDPFLTPMVQNAAVTDKTEVFEAVGEANDESELMEMSPENPTADDTQEYSIPDHVLTPTLADIYYQQGQPQLALQIYRRLLDADPDNDRIRTRVGDIEASLVAPNADETNFLDESQQRAVETESASEESPTDRKREHGAAKPLSGVRIKKKFKSRLRKGK